MLNFETVKYFNAEQHEESRFEEALDAYKKENVKVSKGLVTLNVAQQTIICLGLWSTLILANKFMKDGKLTVGDFVMFNSYNM